MQKEKHVRIELPAVDGSRDTDLPLKFKKSKKKPTSNNFKVMPLSAPQLRELIYRVDWDSIDKKITFKAHENPHFDVYHWIESVKKLYAETQKGPFVDLEQDAVLVHFLDSLGHEVATLKFTSLQLVGHDVKMMSGTIIDRDVPCGTLTHNIVLQYQEVNEVDIREFVDWAEENLVTDNEETDQEWQTVEE